MKEERSMEEKIRSIVKQPAGEEKSTRGKILPQIYEKKKQEPARGKILPQIYEKKNQEKVTDFEKKSWRAQIFRWICI